MPKLNDDEKRAIIGRRFSESFADHSELRADREQALNFYYGRPLGNEVEGRAQVVSKDMMDTIEWMMPSLLRIFTRDALQFDPVGPEDEELAKQETDYISHVLWKKNPGFMLLYNWIKDGLMQKVGYVKYWWEKEEKVTFDHYDGLTDDQLLLTIQELEQQGEVDILASDREEAGTYAIKVRIKKKYGCAKIDVVPPDEIIVSRFCRSDIKKAKFVGHLRRITNSDLVQMGYDRQRIKNLTDYELPQQDSETQARDSVQESATDLDEGVDWATRERVLLECYTEVDADDDGIAELRHFLLGGNDILEDEEFPEVPFDSWTPLPVPHRHIGLGIYDIMEDLQRIKTALQRGLLDNVYFTNAPRLLYDKNAVDVTSLHINRPGGHIAVDGPVTGAAMPVPVNPMAGHLLPVIDYVDTVKETRTGVGRMTAGVDADVLAQSTKGAYIDAKSAAGQRIEAIARIFAETGLSSLYISLHRLLMRHQDWGTREKLRGEWVPVNPTEWMERANLTVSVGLGNASREEVRANLGLMAQAQEKAGAVPGLVQPKNVYALFRRLQTELGFENDALITDPSSPEYKEFMSKQQGQPNPLAEAENIKAQATIKGKEIDATIKREQMAQDRDLKITEMELDAGVDLAKAGIGAEVAAQRGAAQAARANGAAAYGQPGPAGGF